MPECEDESEDKESDAYKIKRQQFSLQVLLIGCRPSLIWAAESRQGNALRPFACMYHGSFFFLVHALGPPPLGHRGARPDAGRLHPLLVHSLLSKGRSTR